MRSSGTIYILELINSSSVVIFKELDESSFGNIFAR
jgi:hypothetical protein